MRSLLVVTSSGLLLATVGCAATGPKSPTMDKAAFDRFAALQGIWQADFGDADMPPGELTYRTIANGSAVVETVFAGGPSEMITVIRPDDEHLRLTHYCAATNQPHLVATSVTEDSVTFETDHVTNHAHPGAVYMDVSGPRNRPDHLVQLRGRRMDRNALVLQSDPQGRLRGRCCRSGRSVNRVSVQIGVNWPRYSGGFGTPLATVLLAGKQARG